MVGDWSLRCSFSCGDTTFSTTFDINVGTSQKLAMLDMSGSVFLAVASQAHASENRAINHPYFKEKLIIVVM